jgi:hypothetical protein
LLISRRFAAILDEAADAPTFSMIAARVELFFTVRRQPTAMLANSAPGVA